MYLQASLGDNIGNFAKVLIEVNKVANNNIIGVFNDVNLWVKEGYTIDTIVNDYHDYCEKRR
jgi:hypothetical protein